MPLPISNCIQLPSSIELDANSARIFSLLATPPPPPHVVHEWLIQNQAEEEAAGEEKWWVGEGLSDTLPTTLPIKTSPHPSYMSYMQPYGWEYFAIAKYSFAYCLWVKVRPNPAGPDFQNWVWAHGWSQIQFQGGAYGPGRMIGSPSCREGGECQCFHSEFHTFTAWADSSCQPTELRAAVDLPPTPKTQFGACLAWDLSHLDQAGRMRGKINHFGCQFWHLPYIPMIDFSGS